LSALTDQIPKQISPAFSTHFCEPLDIEKHCKPASQSSVEEHFEHLEPGSFLQLETINIAENPNAIKKSVGKITFNFFFIGVKH
jgi:hypothetical protein